MEAYNCTKCSEEGGCPFAYTEISDQVQNYGCLPSPLEIINMRVIHGKTWACHENTQKPCLGAISHLRKNNLPYKVIDTKLLTEQDEWNLYVR